MQRISWIALALLLATYSAATLYPYDIAVPATNNAAILEPGRAAFPEPGVLRTADAPAWVETARRTGEVSVALRVRSESLEQEGPARIFTLSADTRLRNLLIGQDGRDIILRIRTPWSDEGGNYAGAPALRAENVLNDGEWSEIRLNVRPGIVTLDVDGGVWMRALPEESLANWDRRFRLALGNELTNDRPWLGEIGAASVATADERLDLLASGVLQRPELLWRHEKTPQVGLTTDYNLVDGTMHLVGYIPLGALLGAMFAHIGRRRWLLLLPVALYGGMLEVAQVFLPSRHASLYDALFNVAGASIGMALAELRPPRKARAQHADGQSRGR